MKASCVFPFLLVPPPAQVRRGTRRHETHPEFAFNPNTLRAAERWAEPLLDVVCNANLPRRGEARPVPSPEDLSAGNAAATSRWRPRRELPLKYSLAFRPVSADRRFFALA